MPPVAAVPVDLAVKVLKKYIAHFANDEFPQWKSEIWKKIANDPELEGKWSIGSVRTNVREDRRGILSEARRQCGITVNIISNKKSNVNENCDISKESHEDFDEDNLNEESDSENDDIHKHERFTVEISRDLWNEIHSLEPLVYKGRKYVGFKPKVWTNAVSNAFWKQHHLKCAFVFKRGRITQHGRSYATIIGRCRAKDCHNPVKGIIKDCPGEVGPVYIEMFCRDTRFVKHEDVKRPLNGTERLKVQAELLKTHASAWRKEKAKDNIDPGDTGSPFVYNLNTLHQAKKETNIKKLGIKTDDMRDMILAIRNMYVDPSYVNSILAIGDTPFYVFYATPTAIYFLNL